MKSLKSTVHVIALCGLLAWVGGCASSRKSCNNCSSSGSCHNGQCATSASVQSTTNHAEYYPESSPSYPAQGYPVQSPSAQSYQSQGGYQSPSSSGSGTRNVPSYGGSGTR